MHRDFAIHAVSLYNLYITEVIILHFYLYLCPTYHLLYNQHLASSQLPNQTNLAFQSLEILLQQRPELCSMCMANIKATNLKIKRLISNLKLFL